MANQTCKNESQPFFHYFPRTQVEHGSAMFMLHVHVQYLHGKLPCFVLGLLQQILCNPCECPVTNTWVSKVTAHTLF